jgi:hypothetical protein
VDPDQRGAVAVRVVLRETLGEAILARLEGPSSLRLTALVGPGKCPPEGERIMVALRIENAFLFDRVTGQNLCQPSRTECALD